MTRTEVNNRIHEVIQAAVERGGGDWRRSYASHVDLIWQAIGKLAPEEKAKPVVPAYDKKKVRRVGTILQRHGVTKEQSDAAVAALRAVGLL